MFWNDPKKSLRWKIAFYYAAAFFVSIFLCFTVIYLTQYNLLYRDLHKQLSGISGKTAADYLRGIPLENTGECIPLRKIDSSTLDGLKQKYPDFRPVFGITIGERQSEIAGLENGRPARVPVEKDGTPEAPRAYPETDRVEMLKKQFDDMFYGDDATRYLLVLVTPDGKISARSPFHRRFEKPFLSIPFDRLEFDRDDEARTVLRLGSRKILVHIRNLHDGSRLIAGVNTEADDRSLFGLLAIFSVALPLMPLLGGALGYFLGANTANGIARIARSAREIEHGNFSERVRKGSEGSEVNDLVDAFNGMAGNTEKVLAELKAVSDDVAHDLRTPITRMRGMAELAIGKDPENALASEVTEECSGMLELINTMLEISRTECAADLPGAEKISIAGLVEKTADLFSTVAEDKNVHLVCELPENEPACIRGDNQKLRRLAANLVDNAIKFTPSGGSVRLIVSRLNQHVIFSVRDSGCGIAPDDLAHIFDRFFRADSSRTLPGNGLGLCLVRAIAGAHGGSVTAASEPGKGTCFTVTFPVWKENAETDVFSTPSGENCRKSCEN